MCWVIDFCLFLTFSIAEILYMYIVFHFICTSYYVKYDTYIISYFVYKICVGGLTINTDFSRNSDWAILVL
jgi:hypothetical protein